LAVGHCCGKLKVRRINPPKSRHGAGVFDDYNFFAFARMFD
jgi:hypothetical protein